MKYLLLFLLFSYSYCDLTMAANQVKRVRSRLLVPTNLVESVTYGVSNHDKVTSHLDVSYTVPNQSTYTVRYLLTDFSHKYGQIGMMDERILNDRNQLLAGKCRRLWLRNRKKRDRWLYLDTRTHQCCVTADREGQKIVGECVTLEK